MILSHASLTLASHMFLDPLRRAHCLFLVALLSTAASYAAVEVITFGDTQSSLQSVTTDNISVEDSVSTDAITLRSGDMVKLNIEKWGFQQSISSFNPSEVYKETDLTWNSNLLEKIKTALSIDVTDLCKSFSAYPAKHDAEGGVQLNLSGTHKAGDAVDIFLLGYITINKGIPYNIGFAPELNNLNLSYARQVSNTEEIYDCTQVTKMQEGGSSFLWLRVQGELTEGCTVTLPLSYTSYDKSYQPYAFGAVFYSYTPAPEPSTAMLTLLALTALAMRRRRRLN